MAIGNLARPLLALALGLLIAVIAVVADARHYFFLKDPAQTAQWVKDFTSRQMN